jgi:aspartyl-tRNA(Asn)/glutamyl-tRNA(Gln) amidotransferase subunit B
VDFNRGGVPLVEIVTKPDFRSAAEAKAYVQELRLIVRSLGISDGDMERGHLRCDVNISLREVDENGLPTGPKFNPKTEIKNINSFRAIERAIGYEITRQTALWEENNPPMVTTTRGWNDETQSTEQQRVKEDSADYRYFPEPDIPPLALAEIADEVRRSMPELPAARRTRLIKEYGFKEEDVRQIVDDPALVDFTERALSELGTMDPRLMRLFAGWLLTKLMGVLDEQGSDIRNMKLTPANFAQFIALLGDEKLTSASGLKVLQAMLQSGATAQHAMQDLGATRMDDVGALRTIVETALTEHPAEVERYKAGEKKLLQFFVGQVIRATRGNADAGQATMLITEILG